MRHRGYGPAIGPRRVQEEAERAIDAKLAQLRAKREEMIVLNPKQRFGRVEAQQRPRHERIDFAVGRVVFGADMDEVGARMQRGPQRRIGETLVETAVMLGWHIDGRERAGAERLDSRE